MKNANGWGSVYNLNGNSKKKKDKNKNEDKNKKKPKRRKPWVARVTIGWSEEGKQLYQTVGYYETKTEAQEALAAFHVNPISPKSDITLKELYEEWSKGKYEYISKSTADNYRAGWKYLSKYETTKFKELRTSHVQGIIDSCYKDKLSRSTLSKIKIVANMLYNYALQNDIVNKNYAEFVTLPKEEKEEKSKFTDLEIKTIEKNADTVPWADTVLILIYSGMRISEMLGLTKFNINLEQGIITGGVKTEAGKNRIIPIHPKIYKYIKQWYDKEGQYLICNDKGKGISTKKYREDFYYPALEQMKVSKLNPHCCRHTFASLLAKAKVPTNYIKEIIGHEKYATTADIYTHTDIEELINAIKMI